MQGGAPGGFRGRDGRDSRDSRDGRPAPRQPAPGGAQARPAAPAQAKEASRIVTVTGPAATGDKGKDAKATRPSHLFLALPTPKVKQAQAGAAKPALTPKEALAARTKAKQQPAAAKPRASEGGERAGEGGATFDAELLSANWDRAVEALRSAGESAAALVDAWQGASNVEAIAAAADAEEAPPAARKAARRALSVLKARGVTIPSRPRVARINEDRAEAMEATLLPPDSSGTSAVTVTQREPSGRYHIAEVIIRENVGVLHAGSGWLSGSQLREGRVRAQESLGTAPVAVPVEWARHRIAQAKRQNASSGQVVPLGYEGCRELVEPAPEAEPRHPLADLEEQLTAEVVVEHAARSQALHDEPEFRSWLPNRQALDEMLQGLGQKLGPDGLRDGARVNAAMREEIDAATDRFFSPEVRAVVAGRMRDSAISLRVRKGDAAALTALAVARAVKEAGLITAPPREIPFLSAFFQKALAMLAQQSGGQLRIPVPAGAVRAAGARAEEGGGATPGEEGAPGEGGEGGEAPAAEPAEGTSSSEG